MASDINLIDINGTWYHADGVTEATESDIAKFFARIDRESAAE